MYNGIKRKKKKLTQCKISTKCKMIQLEETINNGIISQNYVVKTVDFKADPNKSYKDFEVNNLLAAGIDVKKMPVTMLTPNMEKLANNAMTANEVIEHYELVKQIENEQQKQEAAVQE